MDLKYILNTWWGMLIGWLLLFLIGFIIFWIFNISVPTGCEPTGGNSC